MKEHGTTSPDRIIADYVSRRGEMHWQDILGLVNSENACSLDYFGRFLFELLQNAADRASGRIRVHFDVAGRLLFFGNDGGTRGRFTIYPYPEQQDGRISDFHALCSMNTSSKTPDEGIGYKGVGFKSVWEVANQATILSEHENGERWGFRFRRPLSKDALRGADDATRKALGDLLADKMVPDPLPSFFWPEMVEPAEVTLPEGWSDMTTVVALALIPKVETKAVAAMVDAFCKTKIFFIKEKFKKRFPDKDLEVIVTQTHPDDSSQNPGPRKLSTEPSGSGWTLAFGTALDDWEKRKKDCIAAAAALSFNLSDISLTIAFPPPDSDRTEEHDSRRFHDVFYSYLPTEVACGFGVLIHADFFLDNSRKSIDFGKSLNELLLDAAADLLIQTVSTSPVARRDDVWRFVDPKDGHPELVARIRQRLFENGGAAYRAMLDASMGASEASTGQRPERFYQRFFQALSQWRSIVVEPNSRAETKKKKVEDRIWGPIREKRVRCLPIDVAADTGLVTKASPLPLVHDGGKRIHGGTTVFYRSAREDDESADAGVLDNVDVFLAPAFQDVAITSWGYASELWEELKLSEFKRVPVIRALGDIVREATERGEAQGLPHEALLRLLWELLASRKNPSPETRIDDPSALRSLRQHERALGRAFASFHVPTREGWKPAGKVYLPTIPGLTEVMNHVPGFAPLDTEVMKGLALSPSPDAEFTIESFARRLGVWDCIPLRWEGDPPESFQMAASPEAIDSAPPRALAEVLSKNWDRYRELREKYPEAYDAFVEALKTTAWFPIQPLRNDTESVRDTPLRMWLVKAGDRSRLPYLSQYCPTDASEEPHLSADLLSDLGIVPLEPSPGAETAKILAQLRRMRGWWKGQARPISDVATFKPLLHDLTHMLCRCTDLPHPLPEVPLLVEQDERTCWRDEMEPSTRIYFYPNRTRRERSLFPGLAYAVFHPDARSGAERPGFFKELGLEEFRCQESIEGETSPDRPTKDRLGLAMPYLLALSEGVRVGGNPDGLTDHLGRWLLLRVERGEDVYRKVWLLPGKDDGQPEGLNRPGDVFLYRPRKEPGETIVHDFPPDRVTVEAFADAIAEGVFRNSLYSEYFRNILRHFDAEKLDLGAVTKYLRSRGVEPGLVAKCQTEYARRVLSPEKMTDLQYRVAGLIHDITGTTRAPESIDPFCLTADDFRPVPADSTLTDTEITEITRRLGVDGVRIDAESSNRRRFEARRNELKQAILVSCVLATEAVWEKSRRDELARAYDALRPEAGALHRLRFDPDCVLREFLHGYGVRPDEPLSEWAKELELLPEFASGVSLLETGLTFSEAAGERRSRAVPWTSESEQDDAIHVVATRSSKEREDEDHKKHVQGQVAERVLASREAHGLMPRLEQAWPILVREFERLREHGAHRAVPTARPNSVGDLAAVLHVASANDGAGYDVLSVDEELRLVRIEVKSSTAGSPALYLSEQERRAAWNYLFREHFREDRWRLVLFSRQRDGTLSPDDVTETVRDALKSFDPPDGALLKPTNYQLNIRFDR